MDELNKKETYSLEDILKEVDSFCTKYYKASKNGVSADMIDVFKDFNKVYHALRNLTKSNKRKIRGFEKIEKYGDANIPKRGTNKSAGYDIESIEDVYIEPGTTKVVLTGLKAYMMDDEVLKLYIRSSLAIKKGLTLANNVGIIDADYYNNLSNEGHIMVALTNLSDSTVAIKKGDRIAQGIFVKYLTSDDDQTLSSERIGGIGSTNV